MIENGKNYLVTTDQWFFAPDGNNYRAVWGKCFLATTKETLGFNPTHSTNWFIKVGDNEGSVIIAGCQVHYAVRLDEKPTIKEGLYKADNDTLVPVNSIYTPPT